MATLAYIVIIGWFVVNALIGAFQINTYQKITPGSYAFLLCCYVIMAYLLFQI